jgi:hypothetical protein
VEISTGAKTFTALLRKIACRIAFAIGSMLPV